MRKFLHAFITSNLKSGRNPFAFRKVGVLSLLRTRIPSVVCYRAVFHIDNDTHDFASEFALKHGLTTDELFRQLLWALKSDDTAQLEPQK